MKTKLIHVFLISTWFLSACAPKAVEGNVTLKLDYIFGMQLNGSRDPGKDAVCREKFASYIGKPVQTKYKIDERALSAAASFEGKTFELSALGLSDQYSFGIFRPENFPEAYSVLFTISRERSDPVSQVNLFSGDFNCLLSSSGDIFR